MSLGKKKLDHFKKKLLEAREKIINSGIMQSTEDLHIASEDLADEADLATNTINQQVSFSMREREIVKLRRIDAALERVEEGTYGYCLESGEEIEHKRLENQPWAEFCLEVAEEKEREERQRFRRA
jgi:DnaK suppressor protein